jgi:hypothetical protein
VLSCVPGSSSQILTGPLSSVEGVVRDSATNAPIIGARVRIEASDGGLTATAITDSGGAFRVSPVPVGTHTLTAWRIGFATIRQPVVIDSLIENRADVQLPSRAVTVEIIPDTSDADSTYGGVAIVDTLRNVVSLATHADSMTSGIELLGPSAIGIIATTRPLFVNEHPIPMSSARDSALSAAQRIFSLSTLDPESIERIDVRADAVEVQTTSGRLSPAALDGLLEQLALDPLPSFVMLAGGTPVISPPISAPTLLVDRSLRGGRPPRPVEAREEEAARPTTEAAEPSTPAPVSIPAPTATTPIRPAARSGRGVAIINPDSIAQDSLRHTLGVALTQGISVNVEATLSRGAMVARLIRLTGGADTIFVSPMAIPDLADLMLAAQAGDTTSIRIVASRLNAAREIHIDSINRVLRDTVPVHWAWTVTPLRRGDYTLRFTLLGMKRDSVGDVDTIVRAPVSDVTVPVRPNRAFEARRRQAIVVDQLRAHPVIYGLLGSMAVLAVLLALFWNRQPIRGWRERRGDNSAPRTDIASGRKPRTFDWRKRR